MNIKIPPISLKNKLSSSTSRIICTESERITLGAYKSFKGFFEKLNWYLRAGFIGQNFEYDKATSLLDSLIRKSSPTNRDIVLYRGVRGMPEIQVGHEFTEKGFLSTSLRQDVAERFAMDLITKQPGKLLRIKVPKDTKCLSIEEITNIGINEYERLLPRNSKLKIVSYDEKTKMYDVDYCPPNV